MPGHGSTHAALRAPDAGHPAALACALRMGGGAMSEQWDFYFFEHQGHAGSIFVDLGLEADAPLRGFARAARLSLQMRQPRPDGLSSSEEYPQLIAVEDALKAHVDDASARFVGRNTTQGRRDYYFYLAAPSDWDTRVADLMRLFPEYTWRCDVWDDPDWEAYFTFLLPDVAQRHSISNRRVCEALESHGDSLAEPREIDHWAYFADADARDLFVARVATQGFALREAWGPDEDSEHYVAQVFRIDAPAFARIDAITHPLLQAALELDGDYDGWECAVIKADANA